MVAFTAFATSFGGSVCPEIPWSVCPETWGQLAPKWCGLIHHNLHFTRQIYSGVLTAKIKEQFEPIIKRSFNLLITDAINERLKSALKQEKQIEAAEAGKIEETLATESTPKIITTEDELEAFYIIKSLLRQAVDVKRIGYRDTQSYFVILLDDNNRKTVCRLYLGGSKDHLCVLDENKKEVRHELGSLDDIYKYSDILLTAVSRIEKLKVVPVE